MQAVVRSGLVRDGDLAIQDEAAGLVVAMLDPQPGEAVLDACSAPGGKAVFAAQRMAASLAPATGAVLAMDISANRLQLVSKAARVAGVDAIVATAAGDLRAVATPRYVAHPCGVRVLQDADLPNA